MPAQTTYPGVYVEEQPSGVHTIVGVSTSVTAFVGATRRGATNNPLRIDSIAAFTRAFGGTWDRDHPLAHAVGHFFANGGSHAIVVRVPADSAVAASAILSDATPEVVLTLTAQGEGTWANLVGALGMQVEIDSTATTNPNDLFTMVITLRGARPAYRRGDRARPGNVRQPLDDPGPPPRRDDGARELATRHRHARNAGRADRGRFVAECGPSGGERGGNDAELQSAHLDRRRSAHRPDRRTLVEPRVPRSRPPITAALSAAGLGASAALDGSNNLVIASTNATVVRSSVTVLPAASNDGSKILGLGLAFGRPSRSRAQRRCVPSTDPLVSGAAPKVEATSPTRTGLSLPPKSSRQAARSGCTPSPHCCSRASTCCACRTCQRPTRQWRTPRRTPRR